ncbi:hypothetical protein M422DRAFT_274414 [Sphaerobolus stellatus SS14]|uniref:Unplaced genomic scaffold SPHSTscaffold_386, whole genome shotgun sequence n=1 Tax=Sphaerobolus stellatus (strain SS14) TaxID=990650 RepID=A0A0C9T6Z9_SPHS4|nr:hypothetical protein M422DRAFT_274414 [Sphaerobolus stellatus SS14]
MSHQNPSLPILWAVSDDNVKAAWTALLSENRMDFAAARYSRLLTVESNEIEHVFLLGSESLIRLALETFAAILKASPEVAVKHICHLHTLLLKSNKFSSAIVDSEMIDYLVPLGVYRRRLVTTTVDGIDGVVQFTKCQDIPEEMVPFMSQLKVVNVVYDVLSFVLILLLGLLVVNRFTIREGGLDPLNIRENSSVRHS